VNPAGAPLFGLLTNPGVFSISIWFKADTIDTTSRTLISKGTAGNGFAIQVGNGLVSFDITSGASSELVASITAGDWHHVFASFDGSSLQTLIVDGGGLQQASAAFGSFSGSASSRLYIGRNSDSDPNPFLGGAVAELGIWTRILDSSEAAALFAGQAPSVSSTDRVTLAYVVSNNQAETIRTDNSAYTFVNSKAAALSDVPAPIAARCAASGPGQKRSV